jgi:diguanylate cyclase (GGDEF)-like protein
MFGAEAVDFGELFEQEPTPCALLSPDLVIRDTNDAYLGTTSRSRDELIGHHVCDAFPKSVCVPGPYTDGQQTLLASIERAIASGSPDGAAIVRFDKCSPEEACATRFFSPVHIPVKGADGTVAVVLQRIEDVTDYVLGIGGQTAQHVHTLAGVERPSAYDPAALTDLDAAHVHPDRLAGSPPPGEDPRELLTQVQSLQQTVNSLRRERDQLAARALRDPLTGALSRSVFYEELTRALARMERKPHTLAVLFVDLDRLKQVNDSHGHAAGDELIRQTVTRLNASLRPSDAVARIGGDEFVILLDDLQHSQEAEIVAGRILDSLSEPCHVTPSVVISPSASVGIALAEEGSMDADTLLSHSDAAMYKAKQAGRGRYELFDAAAYTAANARVQMESELRRAIPAGQLILHYQPIFDLTTGAAGAVEALLRWKHPTKGLLTADSFIDVAEASGLLIEIGPWVVAESCRQLARWDVILGERAPRRIFVNLSVTELLQSGLHDSIEASAILAGISPTRLVIEVTESGMLDKPESVSNSLSRLLELGCGVAIDDFGTGYSALSRLLELPADILKIDRSFVQSLSHQEEAAAVIAAVLLLAHNLRKTVVAEGVEDADALATLAELGCSHAQGYHLGRPQSADRITQQLREPALVLR